MAEEPDEAVLQTAKVKGGGKDAPEGSDRVFGGLYSGSTGARSVHRGRVLDPVAKCEKLPVHTAPLAAWRQHQVNQPIFWRHSVSKCQTMTDELGVREMSIP